MEYIKTELDKRGFFNIEFLRILFTTMVVISHTSSFLNMPTPAGGYAVEFFFVLSGFFLVWTFRLERPIGQAMLKKYLMWTPLIVFGSILVSGGWKSLEGCLYLQNTGLAAWKDIPNAPAWYLAVLFWGTLFYLCLMKVLKEETRNIVVGCLVFVMALLIQSAPGYDRLVLVFSLIPVGLLRGFVDMGLGYFLAIYLKRKNIEQNKALDLFWSIAEVGLLIWIIGSCCIPEWRTGTRIIVPLVMSALIYSFILKRGILSHLFNQPIFVVLAKPCLAVYLTHWAITRRMLPYYMNRGLAEYRILVIIIFSVIASWLLGMFSYLIVEKPSNKLLLKRFIKNV